MRTVAPSRSIWTQAVQLLLGGYGVGVEVERGAVLEFLGELGELVIFQRVSGPPVPLRHVEFSPALLSARCFLFSSG